MNKQLTSPTGRRWLAAGAAAIVVAIIGVLVFNSFAAGASAAPLPTVAVTRGAIVAAIAGSGTVNAARTLDQSFGASGTVTDVLVREGQTVAQGDVLARLDPRDLELAVGEARAALATANAQREQALAGNATPEEQAAAAAQVANAQAQLDQAVTGNSTAADIASAEAGLRSAQASLQQTRNGTTTAADIADAEAAVRSAQAQLQKTKTNNVTPQDIASAEASVRSAEAALAQAQQGPSPDQVSTAEASVASAQQNYDKTASTAAANKASEEQNVAQMADSVRLAQDTYSTAFWDNQQAQNGRDPASGKTFDELGQDAAIQQRQYEAALRTAETQLRQAESQLQQAKVSLEQAKQQEIVDIQSAQTQLDDARVQLQEVLKGPAPEDVAPAQATLDQARNELDKLRNGGTAADIAIAQASLDQANANLAKLRQGPTAAELAIAQASVDQAAATLAQATQGGTQADIAAAQASLEQQQASAAQLSAPATATDQNIQAAGVEQAEQALKRAELNLEAATLRAPFAGVVTAVNIVPGSQASSGSAALTLIDRSTLQVDLKLSENDAVEVVVGQPVTLSIDSLSGWAAEGEVSYIAPAAETTNDVVTYGVQVSFPDDEPRVKVGMTANVDITTATKDNVLLVPSTALLPKGSGRVVQVPNADGTTVQEVEVRTGLTDGTYTEILGGLDEGDQVVALPAAAQPSSTGLFGG